MKDLRKCLAEFIGTMVLVILGCGTAMAVGCNSQIGSGYLLTALAFGLVIVAMAYSIGNVSGCHINPAVSLAMLIRKKISLKEFGLYVVSQILGAFVGALILMLIFKTGKVTDLTGGYGSNGLSGIDNSVWAGLIVEVVLTFIFVMAILGVTSRKSNGAVAGIVIGLTLVLVHILGIALTGTSVNPARSIGPAVVALIDGIKGPIESLWVFIVGPLAGGALAAVVYGVLDKEAE